MKKIILPVLFAISTFSCLTTMAQFQNEMAVVTRQLGMNQSTALLNNATPGTARTSDFMANNYQRLVKNLTQQYPLATDIHYYEINDGFFVRLNNNGHATNLIYNSQQKFRYSSERLNLQELPQNIQKAVASDYTDYEVKEVLIINSVTGFPAHRIILKNNTNYVELIESEGELTVIKTVRAQ